MLAFENSIFIGSKDDNSISEHIDFNDIISCEKIQELQKAYSTVNQIIWFKLKFKTGNSDNSVVFSSASAKFGADIELEILLEKIGILNNTGRNKNW